PSDPSLRDDAAEFDENTPDLHNDDDKSPILWRKKNKVGLKMPVIQYGTWKCSFTL
ncbi:Hypothetical protein FKW44_013626, partial [Caligus rogercresseyi]